MTNMEIKRRLATLTDSQLKYAYYFVRGGNSARAVAREANISLKQANALFVWQEKFGHAVPSRARVWLEAHT